MEISLTIGKLDASLALLLTKDHHLIEFPTILLPDGVVAGSMVKIKCDRDLELETSETELFDKVQDQILHTFGEKLPALPVLKIRNITQTSCVLEWDTLDLATATIKSLNLYKDGVRLGQIPNPLQNTTTKLSGLPIDTEYKFQLRLSTTAGVFKSDEVTVKTHKMTDLSGITVCIGEIDDPRISRSLIEESLQKMNAKPLQDKVQVDTTHFICTKPMGKEWKKLLDSNIPIVRPEWLKACELERRIIGVRMFYLDAGDDVLKQRDYWGVEKKPLPQVPLSGLAEVAEGASEPLDLLTSEPVVSESAEPTEEAETEPVEQAPPAEPVEEVLAVEPVEETVEPVEAVEAPVEESVEESKPVEEPIDTPTEPVEETVTEPVEPVEEAAEEPIAVPVEEPVEAAAEPPVEEPVEAPVEESIDSPAEVPAEATAEATAEPVTEETTETAEAPATEPTSGLDTPEPEDGLDEIPLESQDNLLDTKKPKNAKKKKNKKKK